MSQSSKKEIYLVGRLVTVGEDHIALAQVHEVCSMGSGMWGPPKNRSKIEKMDLAFPTPGNLWTEFLGRNVVVTLEIPEAEGEASGSDD